MRLARLPGCARPSTTDRGRTARALSVSCCTATTHMRMRAARQVVRHAAEARAGRLWIPAGVAAVAHANASKRTRRTTRRAVGFVRALDAIVSPTNRSRDLRSQDFRFASQNQNAPMVDRRRLFLSERQIASERPVKPSQSLFYCQIRSNLMVVGGLVPFGAAVINDE